MKATKLFIFHDASDTNINRLRFEKFVTLLVMDNYEFRVERHTFPNLKRIDIEVTVKDFDCDREMAEKYLGFVDLMWDGRWHEGDLNERLHADD